MATVFQNGCYVMKYFLSLLLNLIELFDFNDLYIKLYVFDDAKSDSDLQKWTGYTFTHLLAYFCNLPTRQTPNIWLTCIQMPYKLVIHQCEP